MPARGDFKLKLIKIVFYSYEINFRCCRMSINETCFPVEPPDVLPDGTPCIQGFCNKVINYLRFFKININ